MSWPRDDAKLDRVRALMAEHDLDALVVRAPDNVLYLTNFWGMKGYDACVFPREGEPTLIALEASEEDAARHGVDERHPPRARATRKTTRGRCRRGPSTAALEASRGYDRVGLELTMGTQASDRMVGEPTTFTQRLVRRLAGRGGCDAGAERGARDQDRAGDRPHADRERDRGVGHGEDRTGDPRSA